MANEQDKWTVDAKVDKPYKPDAATQKRNAKAQAEKRAAAPKAAPKK